MSRASERRMNAIAILVSIVALVGAAAIGVSLLDDAAEFSDEEAVRICNTRVTSRLSPDRPNFGDEVSRCITNLHSRPYPITGE